MKDGDKLTDSFNSFAILSKVFVKGLEFKL